MPSESGENRQPPKARHPGAPPPGQEQLPCPRCDSTNTKFCYYNNYNFSQPRHFCKSCRRYWTHGGTLRDIPVGGGTRKNAKRSRTTASATSSSTTVTTSVSTLDHPFPVMVPISTSQEACTMQFGAPTSGVDDDGVGKPNMSMCGSFTSFLSNTQGPGFLALGGGGFGRGIGYGFEDMGYGIGRGAWTFPGMADGVANVGGGVGASVVGNSWQLEAGEGGFAGGDRSWPRVAISTPGNCLK